MDMHQTYGNFDFISWDPKTMYTISTSLPVERETTTTSNTSFIPFLPKPESHSQPPIENHNFNSTSSETNDEFNIKDLTGQLIYCEICGYSSIYKEDLKNHKKTHEYSCKRCDKTFKRKMHLKVHMLQHTGERPYKCSQCDRNFTHEAHLKRHTYWHNLKKIAEPEEGSSDTVSQDKILASNIDHIFNYVVNKEYPSGMTRNNRSNLRSLSKHYSTKSGNLYYRHRAKKIEDFGNEYRELMVIRDQDQQRRIIQNIHTGTEDGEPDQNLKKHLGIESTRVKILQTFYWKNVSRDVKEFILACDSCDRLKKPHHNPVYKINVGKCKSRTVSQDKSNNMDANEHNDSTASEDEHDNMDFDEQSSSIELQNKTENIDLIFDYVINKKIAPGLSKNQKGNLRLLSRQYFERDGQLIYRYRAKKFGNSGNEYREVLIIRNKDEQKSIMESMHMDSGDHLGIHRTRIKILEKFYWKNVGKDVRDFVMACDSCQKTQPVRKINMDMIFKYVVNNKYTYGMSKDDKGNLRKMSKQYVAQAGQLYYRHKAERFGNSGNEYRELLVIRDEEEQRRIIKNIHMASGDNSTSHSGSKVSKSTSPSLLSIMKSIYMGSKDSNTDNLKSNTSNLESNTANLESNTAHLERITTNLKSNTTNLKSNTANLESNTANLESNTANLESNAANLESNTTNLKNNTANLKSNTANLKNHFGFEKTRTKILEKYFWKNVGKDVKEFISACDHCKKLKPARKSNDPVTEPLKIMAQIWG